MQGKQVPRALRLAHMFADPEYRCQATWEQAKEEGQKCNKWILLNIQAAGNFASHALNRDCWKKQLTEQLVKNSFILYQYEKTTETGRLVSSFYKIHRFPHISIIDPTTGRQERVIEVPSAEKFPSHVLDIYQRLMEWIETCPTPKNKINRAYQSGMKDEPINNTPQGPAEEEPKIREPPRGDEESNDEPVNPSIDENASNRPEQKEEHNDNDKAEDKNEDTDKNEEEKDKKEKTSAIAIPPLDPEPPESAEAFTLCIRLPQDKLVRRFKKSALVEEVFRFVQSSCGKENFSLIQAMPHINLNDNKNKTLEELNLHRATLRCSFD